MANRFDINKRTKVENESVLVVRNLAKSFGINKILKDVSFDLFKGETLAIIGENGAGKSLTMQIILGLHEKDSGDVWLNLGFDKYNDNLKEIGMQFQEAQLTGATKVKNLIKFYIKFYKARVEESDIFDMEKVFELDKILNKRISSLSGGQKQRLNLFLSIIHNPKIMILDEFITGLDIKSVSKIITYINDKKVKNNASMIIISHQPKEIEALADRVILLKDGSIKFSLTIKEILSKYPTVEDFMEVNI